MFGFLRLLDLFCGSVAIAVVNLFFPSSVLVSCLGVHRFCKCLISAISGFVWCVGGHSQSVSFPFVFFCVVFRYS